MEKSANATLIDQLLAEQRLLTPVARFSRTHLPEWRQDKQKFRELLPLTAPGKGEQYAFEIDLDRCSGCKACVAACHSLNGLEEDESWRKVGLLIGKENPIQQTITTACHHCIEPGCLQGCPALAYEKDSITGVVRHLDDHCIGCQYCILKCPYEVPRYSGRLGIVRKCDMCSSRLAVGEAPACAQACPNTAIRISTINQEEVANLHSSSENNFLPGSADPRITIPTTRYFGKNLGLKLEAADANELTPSPSHWPLVLMLVLTQCSIGGLLAQSVFGASSAAILVSGIAGLLGLTSSIFHLGRPLYGWRAVLGLRHSWLSREVVVFGGFGFSLVGILWAEFGSSRSFILPAGGWLMLATITGLLALFCSSMVYHDTRRDFWRGHRTFLRFAGTAGLLGFSMHQACNPTRDHWPLICSISIGLLCYELAQLRHLSRDGQNALSRSTGLLLGKLRSITLFRLATLVLAGVIIPAIVLLNSKSAPFLEIALFASVFLGELSGRWLFFRAMSQPSMPGGPA